MNFDKERIFLLDVKVFRDNNGKLGSNLYRKPTAGNSILHASSFHPQTLVNSIPYSQYLQIRWNCSGEQIFKAQALQLRYRLLKRGYSHASLKRAYQQVLSQDRSELLHVQKPKNDINPIRIVTRYSN